MEATSFDEFLKVIELSDAISVSGVQCKEYLDSLIIAFKELEKETKTVLENEYKVELI